MEYIINHNRLKKKFQEDEIEEYFNKKNKVIKFPTYSKNYFHFFNNYAKENYQLIPNDCLCGHKNDIIFSQSDRHCVSYLTVVCKNCGLIRAKDYYRDDDISDFYKNFYRKSDFYEQASNELTPASFFDLQKKKSKFRFDLLEKYKKQEIKRLKIVDVGGGIGGILDHFDVSNDKYLFDFNDPYLNFASTKKINTIKGGLDKINFKPDIIILSHVVEHWNNFDNEIQNLIRIQKKNHTLNYIEFPGVDSVNERRDGDLLGDIHVPHVYYFASYVFENIMNRYGFEKVYLDSFVRSIFIYTGKKSKLINYYDKCYKDLRSAENIRSIKILKKKLSPKYILKKILPSFLINFIKNHK